MTDDEPFLFSLNASSNGILLCQDPSGFVTQHIGGSSIRGDALRKEILTKWTSAGPSSQVLNESLPLQPPSFQPALTSIILA